MVEDALIGELGSSILRSGVSALLLFPLAGEDWKNIGEDDGTGASPLRRREARGVVCDCSSLALRVGLLVCGCRCERVERAGEAVADPLVGRPLRRVEAGEDIMSRSSYIKCGNYVEGCRTDGK
jgi:hypothetical protein